MFYKNGYIPVTEVIHLFWRMFSTNPNATKEELWSQTEHELGHFLYAQHQGFIFHPNGTEHMVDTTFLRDFHSSPMRHSCFCPRTGLVRKSLARRYGPAAGVSALGEIWRWVRRSTILAAQATFVCLVLLSLVHPMQLVFSAALTFDSLATFRSLLYSPLLAMALVPAFMACGLCLRAYRVRQERIASSSLGGFAGSALAFRVGDVEEYMASSPSFAVARNAIGIESESGTPSRGRPALKADILSGYLKVYGEAHGHRHQGHTWKEALIEAERASGVRTSVRTLVDAVKELKENTSQSLKK